ncbi:MAG: glycosyltransferase family 2 protein [Bacteroidales bacterium]|nr:glycosyltransferase family 2 protein [Bacteroidales bacterium]
MISLVIPLYNEEKLVDELMSRCLKVLNEIGDDFELIIIDDGSKDQTLEKLIDRKENEKRIKIISLSRNFGHQAAITAGLEFARGDFVAMMDGDLQDPPELITEMYILLKSGSFDIINGKRKSRKEGLQKRLLISIFHKIFGNVSGLKEIENVGNFSMFNRSVLLALLSLKEKIRYLPGLRSFIGFKQGFIEYDRKVRTDTKSKMHFKDLLALGLDAIFSFSKTPLKICIFLGIIGVIVFLFAGIYVLIAKIFGFALLGWSSTMLSIYFLGSIQLIFLGILGEYIFRIYKETQNRPIYFVKEIYD